MCEGLNILYTEVHQ